MAMMKAAVIRTAGGPEVLKIESLPTPEPRNDQVLIRIKAFGLNRSELFTRQGHSPNVKFPRVLGIEAVGLVESAPGNQFRKGDKVATAMGGLGRDFDGGYAEYTCVPVVQVQAIKTELPWETLGALPEMLQTAWGSMFTSLRLEKRERLLIRGGTTSVGLAAAAIAKNQGRPSPLQLATPSAPPSCGRAVLTKCSLIPAPLLNRSRKFAQEVSTRCLSL
jgi:NADPH:quinone reductase-like Zn-dependent oxidoreductase